jgi:hypothetical protein
MEQLSVSPARRRDNSSSMRSSAKSRRHFSDALLLRSFQAAAAGPECVSSSRASINADEADLRHELTALVGGDVTRSSLKQKHASRQWSAKRRLDAA